MELWSSSPQNRLTTSPLLDPQELLPKMVETCNFKLGRNSSLLMIFQHQLPKL